MNKHIIDDARRCLQCPKPQCSMGCPLHTPVRDAIRLLLDGKIEQAGKLLFDNNPLSIVCSHVCPQENQCEGHCVMNKTGMPVNISEIEKYISSFYLNTCTRKKSDNSAGKIGIIGSGPAGMTIAFLLLEKDYSVTIYEGSDYVGGVMRYGIPEFRLPKKNLDELTKILVSMGAKIRPNTTIGANLTVDDLFRDDFDAVFIGTGVWKPQRLNLKGESLGNVNYAIEYLRNPDAYSLGDSLVIIGSGNTAMDVARTAIRHGCRDVTVVCNSDEEAISARKVELDYAKIDGVKILLNKSVIEFSEEGAVFADSVETPQGIVPAAGTVFLWKLVIGKLGGAFGIYELLPAFIFSCICIIVVSLLTRAPSKEIVEDFEAVKKGDKSTVDAVLEDIGNL